MLKNKISKLLLATLTSVFAFILIPEVTHADTPVSGTIDSNTTWTEANSPYILNGAVTIAEGVTLTIDPDVVVKGAYSGSALRVQGTLNSVASSTDSIYFTSLQDDTVGGDTNSDATSTTPAGSDWSGILVDSTGTANLDHTVIRYAGYHSYPYYSSSNIRNQGGILNISNSEIASSSAYGVRHSSGTTTVSNTNIINNSSPGVYSNGGTGSLSVTDSYFGNNSEAFAIDGSGGLIFTTSGNSGSAGGISLSGTIAQDTTLEQNGIPYILNGAVTIAEGVTLTIASGVVVKGAYSGSALRVQGTLDSTVSSTSPAYFTSLQDDTVGGDTNSDGNTSAPAGSDWSGILVDSTGTADLDHTIIRYAGYHSWPYYGSSNIRNQGGILSITNSELASSSAYGVRHSSGTTTVSNSNIINNSSPGVYSNGGAGFLSVTGSYFENNSEALSIDGSGGLAFTLNGNSGATGGLSLSGTIAQNTILEQNEIPYIISGSLTVAEGVTLSVGPGVLVKGAHSGSGISVEGTLDISASSTNPVYFTSLQDDTVGGDTNNDGTSSAPAGNDWSGIVVASTGTVNLDYAVVR